MKHRKRNSVPLLVIISLPMFAIFILLCQTVNRDGLPMVQPGMMRQAEPAGRERTDIVVCCQEADTEILLLLNLTYQQLEDQLEAYSAELLECYGILPGDFAEITYTAEYFTTAGDENYHSAIRELKDWKQLQVSEIFDKQLITTIGSMRYAAENTVQICQYGKSGFVVIPLEDRYAVLQSGSDQMLRLSAYRSLEKEIEIAGNLYCFEFLVLCNQNLSDEEILERLTEGTVSECKDLFFVGYENDIAELNLLQQHVLLTESDEVRNWHLTARQLEIPEIMADLPEAVQQEISRNWNHTDDVIVFSGNFTDDTSLSFNEDNKIIAVKGSGNPAGYVVVYAPEEFFTICAGVAKKIN